MFNSRRSSKKDVRINVISSAKNVNKRAKFKEQAMPFKSAV